MPNLEEQVKSYSQNIQKSAGHGKELGNTKIFKQVKRHS